MYMYYGVPSSAVHQPRHIRMIVLMICCAAPCDPHDYNLARCFILFTIVIVIVIVGLRLLILLRIYIIVVIKVF
jgi:hypothetical protein